MRWRLLALVLIPTITAVAAGGIFIASSVQSALVYQRVATLANLSGTITGLVQALQNEREDTVRYIVRGSYGGRGASPATATSAGLELKLLSQDDAVTDGWASQVKVLAGGIGDAYSPLAQQDTKAAVAVIGNLPAIRDTATGTELPAPIVIKEYLTTISVLLAVESQIAVGSSDSTLAGAVRVLGLVSSMKEEASQQQAILTSALRPDLVSLGQFGPAQQLAITDAQAQQQGDLSEFDTAATTAQRQVLGAVLSNSSVVQAQAQEQQAISLASSNSPIATDPTISDASSALSYVIGGMKSAEGQLADSVISRSASLHDRAITSAAIYSLAVALLLGVALGATFIVGRSMVGPLRRLRSGALEVAEDRLPEVVRRMSEVGWDGVSIEVEPIDVDSFDEIGEVARAFDQVHQEAVRLAGNEAALRGNVSAMFISLSRRSVPLIGHLAQMIDSLEQDEEDTDRLSSLFAMDHLVTRMRRNSENLLVLAGEEPVRKWSEPVPLTDVVGAATSEIEQYSRVQLSIAPGTLVSGHAAADVLHLLAELIENATVFSPRDTPVQVLAQEVPSGGVLIEVRDNGVGISPSRLSEINERIDNPPLVDVSVSQHMGLFAVARLAERNGVRVRLRAAGHRGLSALVWLPDPLISRETPWQMERRVRKLAEDRSFPRPRAASRRAAHDAQRGGPGRPAAGRSNWFRAKRPSGRSTRGAGLSAAALGATGSVPAEREAISAAPAQGTMAHAAAPGTPAQGVVGSSPQAVAGTSAQKAPDGATWTAFGTTARQAPSRDNGPGSDRTVAGLPVRTPGANMIPGSAGGKTADTSGEAEAQAPGRQAGTSETEQVTPPREAPLPRRSPELARERLSGFQLGSREAQAQAPNAGEGASR